MNPLTEDMTHVRNSLLPGLLQTVDFNVKNGSPDLRLFEWGNVFVQESPGFKGIREILVLAGVLHGNLGRPNLHQPEKTPVSFFALKGVIQGLFDALHLGKVTFQHGSELQPGYRVMNELRVGSESLGWMGEVDPNYVTTLKLKCGPVFAFELMVDPLLQRLEKSLRYQPIIPYPVIERDLNFVLDESTSAGEVVEKIRKNGREVLRSVEPVNLFRHESLGAGKKSITFHLVFQSPNITLEDRDVNPIVEDIVRVVEKNFKAKLR